MEELDSLMRQQYPCELVKGEFNYAGYRGNVYKIGFLYIADIRPDNCKILARENGERYLIPFDCFIAVDKSALAAMVISNSAT